MNQCPECGRPVRVDYRSDQRYWVCTGRYQTLACYFQAASLDEERLGAESIVKALVRGAEGGDQLGRDQAKYRRAAGTLANVADESHCLSTSKRETRNQVARSRQTKEALRARFLADDPDPVKAYVALCTLSELNGHRAMFSEDRLKNTFDYALVVRTPFATALKRELVFDLRTVVDELARMIAWRKGDIAALIRDFYAQYDARRDLVFAQQAGSIKVIEDRLAAAGSANIVPFRR